MGQQAEWLRGRQCLWQQQHQAGQTRQPEAEEETLMEQLSPCSSTGERGVSSEDPRRCEQQQVQQDAQQQQLQQAAQQQGQQHAQQQHAQQQQLQQDAQQQQGQQQRQQCPQSEEQQPQSEQQHQQKQQQHNLTQLWQQQRAMATCLDRLVRDEDKQRQKELGQQLDNMEAMEQQLELQHPRTMPEATQHILESLREVLVDTEKQRCMAAAQEALEAIRSTTCIIDSLLQLPAQSSLRRRLSAQRYASRMRRRVEEQQELRDQEKHDQEQGAMQGRQHEQKEVQQQWQQQPTTHRGSSSSSSAAPIIMQPQVKKKPQPQRPQQKAMPRAP